VRRTQEVAREALAHPVISIPFLNTGSLNGRNADYLEPLLQSTSALVASKGSAVVQFVSPSSGDGKTTVSTALAQGLGANFRVCLLQRALPGIKGSSAAAASTTITQYYPNVTRAALQPYDPLEKRLHLLRQKYDVVLLDQDTVPESPPGSGVLSGADITCFVVTAGKTSRYAIRALRGTLQRLHDQRILFILNRFEDPLPPWLRSQ
jgi:hypothetical protein